jgi:hypothetical protein
MSAEQRKAYDLFSYIDNDCKDPIIVDEFEDRSKIKIKDLVSALLSMGIQVDRSVVVDQLKLIGIRATRYSKLNWLQFVQLANQFKVTKTSLIHSITNILMHIVLQNKHLRRMLFRIQFN